MHASMLGDIAKISILTLLAIQCVSLVVRSDEWRDFYSHLSLRLLLLGVVTLTVVGTVAVVLVSYVPLMSLSWLNLFGSEGENAAAFGTDVKFLGILFFLILLLALPKLAIIEEEIFREGTDTWTSGFIRSFIFGMVHMIMGVPLGAALAISIAGVVFTYQYFQGGIRLSALTHFHYNLIAISILLVSVTISSF